MNSAGTTLTPSALLDKRPNSIGFLRLLMASLVLFGHGSHYYAGEVGWWIEATNNQIAFGRFPVDVFFVLSGFLIAASYEKTRVPSVFLWHRFLRIYPAFWVCLFLTALVVAPIAGATSVDWAFIFHNFPLVLGIDNHIAGVFEHNPGGNVINGSLWTLPWEIIAYISILVLGLLGLLFRRKVVVAIFVGLWFWFSFTILSQPSVYSLDAIGSGLRLFTFFFAGVFVFNYRAHIPIKDWFAVFSFAALLCSIWLGNRYLPKGGGLFYMVAPIFLTYLVFWLALRLPFHNVNKTYDLSYGIYIYGTLNLQIISFLEVRYNFGMSLFEYFFWTVVATLVLSSFSWYAIEKPILRMKDVRPQWYIFLVKHSRIDSWASRA